MSELCPGGGGSQEVAYHVDLLKQHGLVDADIRPTRTKDGVVYTGGTVAALTWDGCDYLDAIRDNSVWGKTKKAVRETVGSTTLGMMKSVALMVTQQLVAAHLGVA